MNKLERWENVILLLATVALLPIWLASSREIPIPANVLNVLNVAEVVLVVVLVVILVRRFRRMQAALRENKNRRG